jgi:hypothetical protein
MPTLDHSTSASHPGQFKVDQKLFAALEPELFNPGILQRLFGSPGQRKYWLEHVPEHMHYGDSRAALVIELKPIVIAAYTDELDCIAWLQFPAKYQAPIALSRDQRLLTVNTYARRQGGVAADLILGPGDTGHWGNFSPIIAQFISSDVEAMERRVKEIEEREWQRCAELAQSTPRRMRDGRPTKSLLPAR